MARVASGVALDDGGHLLEDRFCHRCGYNLRGLEVEGRCPECGLAVRESLGSDSLRTADRGWLRTVRRGWWLVMASFGAVVAPSFLTGAVAFGWMALDAGISSRW